MCDSIAVLGRSSCRLRLADSRGCCFGDYCRERPRSVTGRIIVRKKQVRLFEVWMRQVVGIVGRQLVGTVGRQQHGAQFGFGKKRHLLLHLSLSFFLSRLLLALGTKGGKINSNGKKYRI